MLLDPSWSEEDLKKLAGHNLLRVLRQVEKVYIYIYIYYKLEKMY